MIKRTFILFFLLVCFVLNTSGQEFSPEFFVYEWGLRKAQSDQPEYWADLVDKAGFDGMELLGLEKVDKMLPALKKKGMKLIN